MDELLCSHVRVVGEIERQFERASGLVNLYVEHVVVLLPLVQLLPGRSLTLEK